jgi:hypothetical protein
MARARLLIATGAFLITIPPVFANQWVEAKQSNCVIVCRGVGKSAVPSGTHPNGNNYAICAANAGNEGNRPGFNLAPEWSNRCFVPRGGKEVGMVNYLCLCN